MCVLSAVIDFSGMCPISDSFNCSSSAFGANSGSDKMAKEGDGCCLFCPGSVKKIVFHTSSFLEDERDGISSRDLQSVRIPDASRFLFDV